MNIKRGMAVNKLRAVPRGELEIHGMRVIESAIGDEVAYVAFDEDAEFIIKACNAHEQLVEALECLKWWVDLRCALNDELEYPHDDIDKVIAALEACK